MSFRKAKRWSVWVYFLLLTHHPSLITAASASGLYVGDNGPRAMGRGGVLVAKPDDLFAFYYNPAGLTLLEKPEAYVSLGGLFWNSTFERAPISAVTGEAGSTTYPYGTRYPRVENEAPPTPLPAVFFAWPLAWHKLTLGAGFMTPVGPLLLDYPADGSQRFMVIDSTRTEEYVMLGVSGEIVRGLSAGGTFYFDNITLELSQAIMASAHSSENPAREGVATLKAEKFAVPSAILGLRYATESIFLGVAYQKGNDVKLEGTLDARIDTELSQILGMSMFGEQPVALNTLKNASVTVFTPNIIRTGVGYRFRRLYTEFDFNLWQWSRFKEFRIAFDDHTITLDPPTEIGVSLSGINISQKLSTLAIEDRVIPQKMKDVFDLRLGAEYAWSERMDLRAGVFYQPGAVPTANLTPLTFDADSVGITAGATRRYGRFHVDLSGVALFMPSRSTSQSEITAFNGLTGVDDTTRGILENMLGYTVEEPIVGNGRFGGSAYLVFLGVGYQFGPGAPPLQ